MAEIRVREERYELIGRDLIATEPELAYIRNSDVRIAFLASDNPKASSSSASARRCRRSTAGASRRISPSRFLSRTWSTLRRNSTRCSFSTNCFTSALSLGKTRKHTASGRTIWRTSGSSLTASGPTGSAMFPKGRRHEHEPLRQGRRDSRRPATEK